MCQWIETHKRQTLPYLQHDLVGGTYRPAFPYAIGAHRNDFAVRADHRKLQRALFAPHLIQPLEKIAVVLR